MTPEELKNYFEGEGSPLEESDEEIEHETIDGENIIQRFDIED